MLWHVIGWILVAVLFGSLAYSLRFHIRNYTRMRRSAGDDQIADVLARPYRTNVLIMQAMKAVVIAALVYWLSALDAPDGQPEEAQSFADAVMRALYVQSQTYESKVRVLSQKPATDDNRKRTLSHWAESIHELIRTLSAIDATKAPGELATQAGHILDRARQMRACFDMDGFEPETLIQVADEMGQACEEFEKKVRAQGLALWAKGE